MNSKKGTDCHCGAIPSVVGEYSILVDEGLAGLIATAAAVAANCRARLTATVLELRAAGISAEAIRSAMETGQLAKERSAAQMKEVADLLAGTQLMETIVSSRCPADRIESRTEFARFMLIAAGAAMAASCEPCLNKAIPDLIEVGVREADIRAAVEIGQSVKDLAATAMKECVEQVTTDDFSRLRGAGEANLPILNNEPTCCM